MKIKKRYYLQKKKLKKVIKELGEYSDLIPVKSKVEMLEVEPYPLLLVNGEPHILLIEDKPFPTLKAALSIELKSKKVVVDMGAVKFIVNGADVMSPGIVNVSDNLKKDDIVVIVDEKHHNPLSIGIALIDGEDMIKNNDGKAIKNIHYIGDPIWEIEP